MLKIENIFVIISSGFITYKLMKIYLPEFTFTIDIKLSKKNFIIIGSIYVSYFIYYKVGLLNPILKFY